MSRLTVVGVGNRWRHDDAAGLLAARRLRPLLPAARVVETEGEPAGLLDLWEGAEDVVVVDAVRSGAKPGTIHRLDPVAGPLPARLFGGSTHHLSLADAVELARALDRLPPSLAIYGIEGRDFSAGAGLSPEVERAVEAVSRELRGRLEAS